jgi:hypothetical protein
MRTLQVWKLKRDSKFGRTEKEKQKRENRGEATDILFLG